MTTDNRDYESFVESDVREWRVEWDRDAEPRTRTTTLPFIAWYAHEHDDEAEVREL